MPLYDYECVNCGTVDDVFAAVIDTTLPCPRCDDVMTRLFSFNVNVQPDLEPYVDDQMGHEPVYVKSKQHRKQLMKERGLVELG
jgi:putative FmdB family regulatory protein